MSSTEFFTCHHFSILSFSLLFFLKIPLTSTFVIILASIFSWRWHLISAAGEPYHCSHFDFKSPKWLIWSSTDDLRVYIYHLAYSFYSGIFFLHYINFHIHPSTFFIYPYYILHSAIIKLIYSTFASTIVTDETFYVLCTFQYCPLCCLVFRACL